MKQKILALSMAFAFVTTHASLYAVEVSIGVSAPGIGVSIMRGDGVDKILNAANAASAVLGGDDLQKIVPVSFAPAFQIDVMIEFLPNIALETGIGYSISTAMYQEKFDANVDGTVTELGSKLQVMFKQAEIVIPVMLRGQYEFERFLMYGAVGAKLGIPVSKGYLLSQTLTDDDLKVDFSENASTVNLDIAFALGGEYRIANAHYIGLRLGYDLNVLSPLNAEKYADSINGTASDFEDVFQDNFSASLTYRYAFNSKWNK